MTDSIRTKFIRIEKELNATFAEREKEVRGIILALVAREHVFIGGPAGTAKSALASVTCSAICESTFFSHLLTRFSTPEEVFGPMSLNALKEDKLRRMTRGKLPEANVGFLDEIFKANSAVLNSLLTVLNERKFDNDGRHSIPLETMVSASNELPEGPELAALYDRFMLRFWTTYTKTPDAFRRLLTGTEPAIKTTLTLDELHSAQAEAAALPVADEAVEELFKLREEIRAEGCVASDRRWRKSVGILRAAAWLDGVSEVTAETFPVLAHVLWDTIDQIPKLQKAVSKYTSAELAEAQDIADSILEYANNLPPKHEAGSKEYSPLYIQNLGAVTKEHKKAHARIIEKFNACKGEQSKARIKVLADEIGRRHAELKRAAQEALDL
jgi:MoxR-like ATPase